MFCDSSPGCRRHRSTAANTSLMEDLTLGFCDEQQHGFVDDIVKYSQAACRLGRLPTLESIVFMMTPAELDDMGEIVPVREELCASYRVEAGEAERYGLATRALLARARKDGVFCHWRVHFPLYRLLMLTRPEGKLMETSEHSGKVAKTRKGLAFLSYLKKLCKHTEAWEKDGRLHASVHETYCDQVADDKKAEANKRGNAEKRIGDDRKVRGGRMKIPGCPIFKRRTDHLVDVVQHNALQPVMDLVSEEEVEMCLDVLRSVSRNTIVDDVLRLQEMDNKAILEVEESRLMPKNHAVEIRDIVGRLKPHVTAKNVALFSQGLTLIDAVLNACLRCQDLLGMYAFASYMMTFTSPKGTLTEVMEVVLPLTAKNTRASDDTVTGTACAHLKRKEMRGWLAVMLVLVRPLMREHLRCSGRQLCLEVGPFDDKGQLFSRSKLFELSQYAGRHFLGLPRWGYNINRSIHTSNVAFLVLALNEGVEAPWVERTLSKARQSHEQTTRNYSSTEARYSSQ